MPIVQDDSPGLGRRMIEVTGQSIVEESSDPNKTEVRLESEPLTKSESSQNFNRAIEESESTPNHP